MPYNAEIFGATIVFVGSFNPAIVTPDWLERTQLIGPADAEVARASTNLLTSRQVALMETEWFSMQVLENQFTLNSKGALSLAFRDLAVGICTLVPHTPITALGMNFSGHFKMPSTDAYHKIGDTLAPKTVWHELLNLEMQSIGLTDLSMRIQPFKRENRSDSKDAVNIQVQPSGKIEPGIFLLWNDHREMFAKEDKGKHAKAESVGKIVGAEWESSWEQAAGFFSALLDKAAA